METLENQIEQFREKFKTMVSREKVNVNENGIASQKLNRGLDGIAKVGDLVSDFDFQDNKGEQVQLSQLLESGPVVLSFYRGGWCPYCNLELRAYETILPQIKSLRANLIALSPEKYENMQATSLKNQLSFPTGTDEGLRVSMSLGLVFKLSAELMELYSKFGHALSDLNTEGLWELPIPATFVVEPDRRVSFAYANLDYRERLEPSVGLEHLSQRGIR